MEVLEKYLFRSLLTKNKGYHLVSFIFSLWVYKWDSNAVKKQHTVLLERECDRAAARPPTPTMIVEFSQQNNVNLVSKTAIV